MYTYWRSKQTIIKLIHISLKCETIVYPWRLIKFIYATVFYTNFNKEEMLQKHIEIYWKCLVKVQFLIGYAEDGTKNLKQVISTFLISHVPGDHLWSTTMLLRQCWSKILFRRHRRSRKGLIQQRTISDHIRKIGLVCKYSRWVPRESSRKNLDDRVVMCTSPLARNKIEPFSKRMITGNEKWITCNNIARKRVYCEPGKPSPSTSKPNLTLNKRMLRIWWDIRGPIYITSF